MSQAKLNAGEIATAAAVAGTATNAQLVKALWSTRGEYLLPAGTIAGYPFPIGITKADLVNQLRTLPQDDLAGIRLEGKNPSWTLYPADSKPAPKAKAKKAKGTARKAKRAAAPVGTGEPAADDDGDGTHAGEEHAGAES